MKIGPIKFLYLFNPDFLLPTSLLLLTSLKLLPLQVEQSISEWTKQNLWRTAFKKCERIWFA